MKLKSYPLPIENKYKTYNSQLALKRLKEGNERFITGKSIKRNLLKQLKQTAKNQYPFAVIVSCMDSRIPTEWIFDQGIGDIFNIRVAGNVINRDILGSLEFACKVAGAKLILVLGHTNCGAIRGACDRFSQDNFNNLSSLLRKIKPAVKAVPTKQGEVRSSKNRLFVNKVSKKNVLNSIKEIKNNSKILKKMLDNGEIDIKGAMYHLENGRIEFYKECI